MTKKTKMLLGILAAVVVIAGAGLFSAQSGLFKGMIFSKNIATQKVQFDKNQKTVIPSNIKPEIQILCMEVGPTLILPADAPYPNPKLMDLKAIKFKWLKATRAEEYEFLLIYPDGTHTTTIVKDTTPASEIQTLFFDRKDFKEMTGHYQWTVTSVDTTPSCSRKHGGDEWRDFTVGSFADLE